MKLVQSGMTAKIFDSHTHVGHWGTNKIYDVPITPFIPDFDSYESYLENFFNKYEVSYSIVVPHYVPDQKIPFREFNPLVLNIVRKHDHIFGGLWVSPLSELARENEEALLQADNPKIKVLKLSADTWGTFSLNPNTWDFKVRKNIERIIEVAQEKVLVVQIHTGSRQSDVDNVDCFLRLFGKMGRFQLIHMGGNAGGHFKFVPRFFEWLDLNFDIYTDFSWSRGFGPRWLVRELVSRGIPVNRVLLASDEPWGDLPSEVSKILNLNCDNSIKENILFNNAYQLYCEEKLVDDEAVK